jgi:hypothetical protein
MSAASGGMVVGLMVMWRDVVGLVADDVVEELLWEV